MDFLTNIILIGVFLFLLKMYCNGRQNLIEKDLKDKVVVITGGTHGMGIALVRELLKRHATVVSFSRNESLAQRISSELIKEFPNAQFEHITMDLGDLKIVKEATEMCIEKYPEIDYIIDNAGILISPFTKTKQNLEGIIGINYVGHFLFNLKLLNALKIRHGRFIITSSIMAQFADKPITLDCKKDHFNCYQRYSQSKLALMMMAKELSLHGIEAVSIHPGVVVSNILNKYPTFIQWGYKILGFFIFKSVEDGIQTALHCIFSDSIVNGGYYKDCECSTLYKRAENTIERQEIWDKTYEIIKPFL
ncbi:restnol dehydrogenase, putative [Entamoeba dispar SAW760]|uniref:Restnol dehydrogenase, putative n=1 Tax=Entamoeba dispar (strain ATCC PRA-260 / SAW760) TaxID=370354 RepID=B0EGA4_ENTDS|nr:restnol dehydrogenase, putative [Entamoeba dispar SAW760]EDR26439.1 restnol dehydrogenase, putative [Entamoeba dispar SAW760]|eukprot:EDR26439.1 restnol dehydrogenase, putative [Entamoeba dispar SAW760]